nr:fibronectin type III domain-containing protein [Planosporangium thailandense]
MWHPAGEVDWGTGTPHTWVIQLTTPKGATVTENTCVGEVEDSGGLNDCSFVGSIDGTYTVKVTAKTPVGTSTESATESVTVKQTVFAPGKPQNLKALPGPNELVVSWQPPADPGDGVAKYHAEAVLVNGQADAGSCETAQLTCTIKGLNPGTSYDVWVFSVGAQGDHDPEPAELQNVKPLAPVTSPPTPPASVPSSAGKVTAPSSSLTSGKSVTLSGSGYAPDSPVQIVVYSSPKVLKTVTTDGTGSFSVSVTLPAGLTGSHTLVAGGVGPDGAYRYLTLPVTVSAAGTGGTGGGLPITGQSVPKLVVTALLVLAFGVVLVRLSRRRAA